MRIVLLSTFHERCGIATYSEALARALAAAGAHVEVLAPRRPVSDPGWGDQPPRLWRRNRAFGFEALGVMREIRRRKPDLVHAQINLSLFSSRILFNLAWLLSRAGIPMVATLHGRPGGSWGRNFKLRRFSYALRDVDLIVHTDDHRRELSRERVHVVPHGIELPERRTIDEARAALGLDSARRVIAHFGFLVPDKGVVEVLRAVDELARTDVPDIFYWIAGAVFGSAESRAYFNELTSLVRSLGLEKRVRLTGEFVDEPRAMLELQAADWIVLNYQTGNSQGASGAARKALASGRPVAVSAAPVFDDVREATHTLGTPLAESLSAMLADRALAITTADRGRSFCERHSWDNVARRHLEIYAAIAARPDRD